MENTIDNSYSILTKSYDNSTLIHTIHGEESFSLQLTLSEMEIFS